MATQSANQALARQQELVQKLFSLRSFFGCNNFVLPIERAPEKLEESINLKGKIVLVSGGSRGIGRAVCEKFAKAGCIVFGTSRTPDKVLKLPDGCTLLQLDVRDELSVAKCIETIVTKYGRIDILVNNAGIGQYGRLITTTIDDWKKLFDTNLFGVHRMTVAAYPHMKNPESRIITIGSLDGEVGYPYQALYSISKRALQFWSDLFSLEMRNEKGPTFTLLEPGFVRTDFAKTADIVDTEPHSTDRYESLNKSTFGWLLDNYGIAPEEVGNAIYTIAASKNPQLRYFVDAKGAILQGKTFEEILEMVFTKPAEDRIVYLESQINFLYAMFSK